VTTAISIPKKKHAAAIITAANPSRWLRPLIAAATREMTIAGGISRRGCQMTPIRATAIASALRNPATVSAGRAAEVSS
jgi:hypothetical protein